MGVAVGSKLLILSSTAHWPVAYQTWHAPHYGLAVIMLTKHASGCQCRQRCKPRVGPLMSYLFLLCLVVKSEDHHILHTLYITSVAWAIAPAILSHMYAVVHFSFITSKSHSQATPRPSVPISPVWAFPNVSPLSCRCVFRLCNCLVWIQWLISLWQLLCAQANFYFYLSAHFTSDSTMASDSDSQFDLNWWQEGYTSIHQDMQNRMGFVWTLTAHSDPECINCSWCKSICMCGSIHMYDTCLIRHLYH